MSLTLAVLEVFSLPELSQCCLNDLSCQSAPVAGPAEAWESAEEDPCAAGLDSTTAMHCVGILRELAAGGRSIITTIHQPSSRLYQSLDKLLLLSQVRHPCLDMKDHRHCIELYACHVARSSL